MEGIRNKKKKKKNPNKCDDSLGDNDLSNAAAAAVTKGAGVINKRTESKHLGELFHPSSPLLTPPHPLPPTPACVQNLLIIKASEK